MGSLQLVTGKVTTMNGYEKIEGDGDTITCDNCSDIVKNWYSNDFHAICGKCVIKEMAKCRYCNQEGYLVLSTAVEDEICEGCGEWQDGIYNSAWAKVGYKKVTV